MEFKTKLWCVVALVAALLVLLAGYGAYQFFTGGTNTSSNQETSTTLSGENNSASSYSGTFIIGGSILGGVLVALIGSLGYMQTRSNNATILAERRMDLPIYLPSAPYQSAPYNSHHCQGNQPQHSPSTQQPHQHTANTQQTQSNSQSQNSLAMKNEVERLMREYASANSNGVVIAPSSL